MARIARPPFRRKTGLRISKGEAALEAAFKEQDVETVTATTGTVTLTRVPDIIISTGTLVADLTIDIVLPLSEPQVYNKVVRVANTNAALFDVKLSVKGGTPTIEANDVAPQTAESYFIADASANTTPVKV